MTDVTAGGSSAPLWTGCSSKFPPVGANAYDGDRWLASVLERSERWKRAISEASEFPPEADRPSALPMLLGATGGARTSVLDIGGGGANAYHHARASARVSDLRWTVVERPAVCEAMRQCRAAAEVEFLPSVPPGPFDIVFFGSSLQYFEDWRTALRGAAEASAGFVLLEDVPLVRSPSFVAEQRYFEGVIPVWFLNHKELLGVAAEAALRLVAWDRYRAGILGRWSGFPMDNYPPDMRVGLPSSLLFRVSR